eukprot:CAMPEP_0184673040 /NCGR_PEP_ID=MMETSP0308-20130426/86455_1 /TAXON_ID=38269 /ORGANISM="Gloeochaete witrockiana, Strain SAG 46.84" /LENGTH=420 /DNA_ID=CAMNT_0027120479 /DNA_START=168 /DNA_END=1427 /DNA_ORIENTATION=+
MTMRSSYQRGVAKYSNVLVVVLVWSYAIGLAYADIRGGKLRSEGDVCVYPMNVAPVCGEDCQTYSNWQKAACKNVSIAYEGQCLANRRFILWRRYGQPSVTENLYLQPRFSLAITVPSSDPTEVILTARHGPPTGFVYSGVFSCSSSGNQSLLFTNNATEGAYEVNITGIEQPSEISLRLNILVMAPGVLPSPSPSPTVTSLEDQEPSPSETCSNLPTPTSSKTGPPSFAIPSVHPTRVPSHTQPPPPPSTPPSTPPNPTSSKTRAPTRTYKPTPSKKLPTRTHKPSSSKKRTVTRQSSQTPSASVCVRYGQQVAVCGKNCRTYWNAAEAQCNRVPIAYIGACVGDRTDDIEFTLPYLNGTRSVSLRKNQLFSVFIPSYLSPLLSVHGPVDGAVMYIGTYTCTTGKKTLVYRSQSALGLW